MFHLHGFLGSREKSRFEFAGGVTVNPERTTYEYNGDVYLVTPTPRVSCSCIPAAMKVNPSPMVLRVTVLRKSRYSSKSLIKRHTVLFALYSAREVAGCGQYPASAGGAAINNANEQA
jgi:hypothetical protein